MKFAVYAALIAVCAAEHESEEMKDMDEMKDRDDRDRMDDKDGKDDSDDDRDKQWCEYGMHVFKDDMCMDKPDDGMMMQKVGGCLPFDMVRDTLFLNSEELAKRAMETGSPDIFPKSVMHRCNDDFNVEFYSDEDCKDEMAEYDGRWNTCLDFEADGQKTYYMLTHEGGSGGRMDKGMYGSGAMAMKAATAAIMAIAATQF